MYVSLQTEGSRSEKIDHNRHRAGVVTLSKLARRDYLMRGVSGLGSEAVGSHDIGRFHWYLAGGGCGVDELSLRVGTGVAECPSGTRDEMSGSASEDCLERLILGVFSHKESDLVRVVVVYLNGPSGQEHGPVGRARREAVAIDSRYSLWTSLDECLFMYTVLYSEWCRLVTAVLDVMKRQERIGMCLEEGRDEHMGEAAGVERSRHMSSTRGGSYDTRMAFVYGKLSAHDAVVMARRYYLQYYLGWVTHEFYTLCWKVGSIRLLLMWGRLDNTQRQVIDCGLYEDSQQSRSVGRSQCVLKYYGGLIGYGGSTEDIWGRQRHLKLFLYAVETLGVTSLLIAVIGTIYGRMLEGS
ncbi:hypothetical protein Tco_0583894 [Tanacetum coccineum]|uniref:Uncharacterized protein n=1 Tax=Tanacetum coccineum TaxID=301880 RepID=A0ABQ4ZUQ2_9ASTR